MMKKISSMLGKTTTGYLDILHIFTHPDILPNLKVYIQHIEDLESSGKDLS